MYVGGVSTRQSLADSVRHWDALPHGGRGGIARRPNGQTSNRIVDRDSLTQIPDHDRFRFDQRLEAVDDACGLRDIKHVPYRTTPAAVTGLLSNDVQMTFEPIPAVQGQISATTLRALAVTSPERFPSMLDVPTITETGIPYNVTNWYGMAFPAGTPDALCRR